MKKSRLPHRLPKVSFFAQVAIASIVAFLVSLVLVGILTWLLPILLDWNESLHNGVVSFFSAIGVELLPLIRNGLSLDVTQIDLIVFGFGLGISMLAYTRMNPRLNPYELSEYLPMKRVIILLVILSVLPIFLNLYMNTLAYLTLLWQVCYTIWLLLIIYMTHSEENVAQICARMMDIKLRVDVSWPRRLIRTLQYCIEGRVTKHDSVVPKDDIAAEACQWNETFTDSIITSTVSERVEHQASIILALSEKVNFCQKDKEERALILFCIGFYCVNPYSKTNSKLYKSYSLHLFEAISRLRREEIHESFWQKRGGEHFRETEIIPVLCGIMLAAIVRDLSEKTSKKKTSSGSNNPQQKIIGQGTVISKPVAVGLKDKDEVLKAINSVAGRYREYCNDRSFNLCFRLYPYFWIGIYAICGMWLEKDGIRYVIEQLEKKHSPEIENTNYLRALKTEPTEEANNESAVKWMFEFITLNANIEDYYPTPDKTVSAILDYNIIEECNVKKPAVTAVMSTGNFVPNTSDGTGGAVPETPGEPSTVAQAGEADTSSVVVTDEQSKSDSGLDHIVKVENTKETGKIKQNGEDGNATDNQFYESVPEGDPELYN